METYCWLSAFAVVVLSFIAILLYIARKARADIDARLADHSAQLFAHAEQLVAHGARLALLDGGGNALVSAGGLTPASARRVALDAAPAASGAHRVPAGQPVVGLSRPFQPSPAQVAAARAAHEAPTQTKTPEQIRARLEAEEDERERARARGGAPSIPTLDDDEKTMVQDVKGLRAAVQRASDAFSPPVQPQHAASRARTSSSPTLVSAGAAPLPSTVPSRSRKLARPVPAVAPNTRTAYRIDVLFWEKLTRAARNGVDAAHCHGLACESDQAVCGCPCAPCDRRRTLRELAAIEITGPQTAAELVERARAQDPTLLRRIERRWHEKIAAAQEAGKNARHCHLEQCMDQGEGIALCACGCDGCALVTDLLVQAQREIVGR